MAIEDRLRPLALSLTHERIATIERLLEDGIATPQQHEALYLEVDRLVGTAMQARLSSIAEAGKVLRQRLTLDVDSPSWQHSDHALITEALQSLREAVAQAATQHADPAAEGEQSSKVTGE